MREPTTSQPSGNPNQTAQQAFVDLLCRALDSLSSQERAHVHFRNGEIIAPPEIKARLLTFAKALSSGANLAPGA